MWNGWAMGGQSRLCLPGTVWRRRGTQFAPSKSADLDRCVGTSAAAITLEKIIGHAFSYVRNPGHGESADESWLIVVGNDETWPVTSTINVDDG